MLDGTFLIGSPGRSPSEAFRIAVSVAKSKYCNNIHVHPIINKFSYFILDDDMIYDSYTDAQNEANIILNNKNKNSDIMSKYAVCLQYKNINGGIDYLFFGWDSSVFV